MLFHIVPEAQVVIRNKGVFRQVPIYRRGEDLFAKVGSGFIGLRKHGGTTVTHILWDYIDNVEYQEPSFGPIKLGAPAASKLKLA